MREPPQRTTTEETLFLEALALPPAMRPEFLERTCKGDRIEAGRLRALLEDYEKKTAFLDIPAAEAALKEAAMVLPAMRPEPQPGDRIGRYRIVELIGEGGFGIVYVAEQEEPVRRSVALKVIRLGMDTCEFITRFEAERQALALMDHPNIARVFDAGATENGRPYLVMELVRGIPITTYCDHHRLSLHQRLELFITVCRAIQHAHQKGVIHRDLKPSNILVAHEGDAAVPKVIDFGIAKATSGPLTDKTLFTQHHALIGTPGYTSPEQMEIGARDVDTRSDLYSLGALLYELLIGCPPFDRAELQRASFDEMRRIVHDVEPLRPSDRLRAMAVAQASPTSSSEFPRNGEPDELTRLTACRQTTPTRLVALLRGDLDWIAMRCLEKDRSRRYETANALALDLRRYLENEPVVARPPSRSYRVRKFVRRHRIPVYAATAVALSLVGGLIATGSLLVRERAAAEKSRQVAQFMKDMLGGIGPSVARGRDTTLLREVLDTTIRRLDSDLQDQPDVAADLRHTLGVAFHAIGDYDQAEKLWRDAIAARRALGHSKTVELAATLHDLGSMLGWMNHIPEAESALEEALAIRRKTLGRDHFDVGTTLARLAYNIGSHRSARDRETLVREAVAIQRASAGHNDDEFAQTLMILGYVLISSNRYREAEVVLRESVAIRRKLPGDFHPNLAESIGVLVQAISGLLSAPLSRENWREELNLRREVLMIIRQGRGLAHAKLVAAFLNFTSGHFSPDTLADDLRLAREVFAELRQALPADSPDLAVARLALAASLDHEPGQSAEAEMLARDAVVRIRRARENGESPHRDTSAAMQYFAWRTYAGGRLRYALPMAEALNADVKFGSILTYGPPIARVLGYIYFDLGRLSEATTQLEISVRSERPLWRTVQRAHLFVDYACLGDAYRELGQPAESRRILEEGLARKFGNEEENDPAQVARAAVRTELGYTALEEKRFAEAEALFRAALKEYDSGPAVSRWDKLRPRGRVISGLGQALAGQGKFAEAEPLVIAGFSELKSNGEILFGDRTRMLRAALDAIVQVYRIAGKPDQAAEWERQRAEL